MRLLLPPGRRHTALSWALSAALLPLAACQSDVSPTALTAPSPEAPAAMLAGSATQRADARSGLDDALGRVAPSIDARLRGAALDEALTAANVALAKGDARAFDLATRRAERAIADIAAADVDGANGPDLDVLRGAIADARALLASPTTPSTTVTP